ncbi:MAG TPA: ABC transporter ATP-binding protein [Phycisphaerae bacterium]|nr:ABC transporter ATP-binding protein [Phycisphaerae bacterium]
MSEPAVRVRDLHKSYRLGRVELKVLRGVSVTVRAGEFVGIVGASGSGKSTLLHLVGLLDKPDKGQIVLDGVEAGRLSRRKRDRIRCRHVGFVFQFYHLLPELNVLENAMLPAKVDSSVLGWFSRRAAARKRAAEILDRLGLAERLKHRPKELSGGERQRVAIARALINAPRILLADEPTGNLDSKTGSQILDVLRQYHAETSQTIVMVTHDQALAGAADRVLHIRDGRVGER